MKTLYIDNYKGFVNTFIPFMDVNFLVGENSTGKTAILNLLNIITTPSFWINPEFNNETVELGYFNEIVNQCSKDKSYFVIGIEYKNKKNKTTPLYLWIKFNNKNNLPNICEYMTIIGNKSVLITLQSSIYYQIKEYKYETFSDWINNKSHSFSQKKKLSNKFPKNTPIALILKTVELEISENQENNSLPLYTMFNRIHWIAPIRAKAQRTYESFKETFSPEGDHIPNILRTIMSSKDNDNSIIDTLMKFGKESALFDHIQIDEYSKIKGAPYAINILYGSLPIKITNVGYGVSQVLPLIVEISISKNTTFAIQQPEVHLHPKAQAAFGEYIYNSVVENKNKFIIETHSDYTINRFRYKLSKPKDKNKGNIIHIALIIAFSLSIEMTLQFFPKTNLLLFYGSFIFKKTLH